MAAALEVIGDPWTMLILRDAFLGVRRFEQWHEKLGVARNVLAARLKALTANGVLDKLAYNERPLRHEYVLSAKGRDLFPIIAAMLDWGDRYVYGEGHEPHRYHHVSCGNRFIPVIACSCCGQAVDPRGLRRVSATTAMTVGQVMSAKAPALEDA